MAGTTVERHRARSRRARHQRFGLAGAAMALALALAACSGSGGADTSGTPKNTPAASLTGADQIGGAPVGTATTGAARPPAAAAYPHGAKAYAQALLKAWNRKDQARLAQLATAAAVQQIKDSVQTGGLPNPNWQYVSCEGATGSTYCTFRNDNGDQTVIRLENSQLGHPTAVTEAPLDRTVFAADAVTYVANFIGAWQHGNTARMKAYATNAVIRALPGTPPSAYSPCSTAAAGSTYVRIQGLSDSSGYNQTFRVLDTTLGHPHAILEVSLLPALC